MTTASQFLRFRAAAVLLASLTACAAPGDEAQTYRIIQVSYRITRKMAG